MIQIIINLFWLILGFIIGTFINHQTIFPIIYSLPKSIWLVFHKELKVKAIFILLIAPIIWYVGITVLFIFIPTLMNFIENNYTFNFGWTVSLIAMIYNLLTVKGRIGIKNEYDAAILQKYKK